MKLRFAVVIIAILAITGSLAAYYRGKGGSEDPKYTTAPAVRGDVVETVEATGTLGAVTTVQVGSQVSGTIESLHADFNSLVKKGQVIARLDAALLQAQVDQAAATVARLQADVERARVALDDAQVKRSRSQELFARGLIPAAEVETVDSTARQARAAVAAAQAQVTQARAALNQNRVNLSHTVITSPVDGIVISRNVDVGQTVAASMSAPTLFVIANDLTDMQVEANVDEADVGRIDAGMPVTFPVDAQLPTSNSQLPTSNFQLPTSNSQLPTSNFQLPTPNAQLPTPNARGLMTDPASRAQLRRRAAATPRHSLSRAPPRQAEAGDRSLTTDDLMTDNPGGRQ